MKLKPVHVYLNTSVILVEEMGESVELHERDEDEEDEVSTVPVETESYVTLRKRMVRKREMKMDNFVQENGKLCQEFRRKQVKYILFFFFFLYVLIIGVYLMHR